jgi:uncharacterized protein YceH (UPF0502 family)
MDLSAAEIRVLGCLIEKERTTPDQYPLTTNSLRLACNQRSNREPVVEYDERTVDAAMLSLRERKLARTVVGGGRTSKHRHVLGEAWDLDDEEVAVLCVMALRGPQTPGELRTRTERMVDFSSLEHIERVLERMAARPEPLAVNVGRRPGQKEERWAHLLAEEIAWPEAAPARVASGYGGDGNRSGSSGAAAGGRVTAERLTELEEEVRSLSSDLDVLRRQFDRLCEQLGVEPD